MVSDIVGPNEEGKDTPNKRTTIPVFTETKIRLGRYGSKGTTWDSLANDLMDRCDAQEFEIYELKKKIRRLEGFTE